MGTRVLTFFHTNLSFEGYFLLQYFPLNFLCHFLGGKECCGTSLILATVRREDGLPGKKGDQDFSVLFVFEVPISSYSLLSEKSGREI